MRKYSRVVMLVMMITMIGPLVFDLHVSVGASGNRFCGPAGSLAWCVGG